MISSPLTNDINHYSPPWSDVQETSLLTTKTSLTSIFWHHIKNNIFFHHNNMVHLRMVDYMFLPRFTSFLPWFYHALPCVDLENGWFSKAPPTSASTPTVSTTPWRWSGPPPGATSTVPRSWQRRFLMGKMGTSPAKNGDFPGKLRICYGKRWKSTIFNR